MTNDSEQSGEWLDFKDIKMRVEVQPVLEYFGIWKRAGRGGMELVHVL